MGSGARAAGVGSAFIAVADDATAASWNPAGLIQLERPEVSAVGSFYYQWDDIQSVSFDENSSIAADRSSTEGLDLNFLSVAYPFQLIGRNWVISLNYQRQMDFNRDLNFVVDRDVQIGTEPVKYTGNVAMEQRGGLGAVSPALAVQIVPRLSIGVALNFWMDEFHKDFAWERETTLKSSFGNTAADSVESLTVERDTYKDFDGTNATFGLLWEAYNGLSFGAFFELGFSADVKRHIYFMSQSNGDVNDDSYSEEITVDLPDSFGLGLSMRFTDSFMMTMDYTHVFWQDFVFTTNAGNRFDVQGVPMEDSDIDGTHTFRIGAEYLWILDRMVLPFRGGAFYDPQPAEGGSKDYFGFSVGTGLILKHFSLDWAYQIRIGLDDTESNLLNILGTGAFEDVPVDTFQHLFLLSTIVRF